ncbi:hypothetical protein EMIT0194MI4_140098 [Pseudomonas sp. IT-194MI4]
MMKSAERLWGMRAHRSSENNLSLLFMTVASRQLRAFNPLTHQCPAVQAPSQNRSML